MKENQRVALTKRLLQEALFRLLETTPLEKISITQLCRESQINRATFYRHYQSPGDILMQMQMDFSKQLEARHPIDNTTVFSAHLESLLEDLHEHADLIRIFLKNNTADDIIRLIDHTCKQFIDLFSARSSDRSMKNASNCLPCSSPAAVITCSTNGYWVKFTNHPGKLHSCLPTLQPSVP